MPTTYHVPGLVITEREHQVPLVHDDPAGPTITVFTRELAAPDGGDRPYLVFLQGGPGFEAARPTSPPSGWQKRAIEDYRVLLLDQRGTGRSTPVGRDDPRRHRAGAGDLPDPLPRRFDRPRLRGDPARARRRALEHPGPELRRVHLADLPVVRARGAPRGDVHRRPQPGRPPGRRHLRRDVGAASGRERALLRPLSRRSSAGQGHPRPPRRETCACRAATG